MHDLFPIFFILMLCLFTGSSNTTQSYSPSAGSAPITVTAQCKKSFARPKGAESGVPLLRRALSPDRLHPRSAETKCSISPLCSSGNVPPAVKSQSRSGTSSVWRPSANVDKEKEGDIELQQCNDPGMYSFNVFSIFVVVVVDLYLKSLCMSSIRNSFC